MVKTKKERSPATNPCRTPYHETYPFLLGLSMEYTIWRFFRDYCPYFPTRADPYLTERCGGPEIEGKVQQSTEANMTRAIWLRACRMNKNGSRNLNPQLRFLFVGPLFQFRVWGLGVFAAPFSTLQTRRRVRAATSQGLGFTVAARSETR